MKRFALWFLSGAILFVFLSVAYFAYEIRQLKTGDFLYWPYHPNGERFSRHIGPKAHAKQWTPLGEITEPCQHIFVSAEDLAFQEHHGVVWKNLWIAAQINWRHRKIVFGASTITQQLAKNLFLWRDKTLTRKSLEIVGAILLDAMLTKNQQLELYLNAVEFGNDLYGINNASKVYFEKEVKELNMFECGVLAGILPFPRRHFKQLVKGEFDVAVAKDIGPMLRAYAQGNPDRGQPLLDLFDLANSTKTIRKLKA